MARSYKERLEKIRSISANVPEPCDPCVNLRCESRDARAPETPRICRFVDASQEGKAEGDDEGLQGQLGLFPVPCMQPLRRRLRPAASNQVSY